MVLYPNKLPESERVCSGICKLPDKTILDLGPAGVRKLLLPRPARKTDDRQLSFDFQD